MANIVTRSTSEKLDELAQVITRFQDHFNLRMDEVTNRVESLERRSTTPEPINLRHDNDSDHTPRHILKLDVPRFQGLKEQVLQDPSAHPNFRFVNGLLLRQGRIWISPNSRFKSLLLREYHETLIGGSSSIDAYDSVLQSRDEILHLLRKNLSKAQLQMTRNANKHRREVQFAVGSWVYVKLQPYQQVSLSGNKYHKLSKRYYGPYLVLAKVGPVAYKLELPSHSRIHNVFHSSLLKLHEGVPPTVIDQIPHDSINNHPVVTPLAVLEFQTRLIEGIPTRFALVQWQGLSPDDTSWENWEELRRDYNLEDKVDFVGRVLIRASPLEMTLAQ
ncbi:hypothetical protein KIW84_074990 [Lathyrus oleraceus]|uniref:Tf2-1-like SH3-like domain-containing protein n=1 Tax=Pisum sativum TaxID=3888 RepID=A0A9D4VVK4_PEA|nr:hypothetical protein KIW84_074990 [Pisum sativum]